MSRYARQIMLPEMGAQGQAKLSAARVLVVGAGGLGCPVLSFLVGAGVGQLTIVDADTVSISNLHRQTLYRETDEGRAKVHAAADSLRALNAECQMTPLQHALTASNAAALVAGHDIILDCADSFACSYILSDACYSAGVPLVSASVLGLQGYVGGFCGGAPSLRALFPELPDRAPTCATAGVMGAVVGLIGAAQAQMAVNIVLELEPSPLGQLLSFDMTSLRSTGFRFDNAPEPAGNPLRFVDPEQLSVQDFVVELRGKDEAPVPVTPVAQRLTVDEFKQTAPCPADGQRAVFACRSGLRAWQAAAHLRTYWSGPISLIAMGDTPKDERQPK